MAPVTKIFSRPGAKGMMAAGVIGRLPMGMVSLALTLLIVGSSGSYALAGAVTATTTIAIALIGPYNARLVDTIGQTRAIPLLLAINISAYLLLTLAVVLNWPVALWFLFAAIAGASMPSLGSMTRARWVRIADNGAERSAAFAVESVADELSFVLGPMIASLLAVALFPAAPILFGMLALLVGGLGLAAQRGTAPEPGGRPHPGGPKKKHVAVFAGISYLFAMMLALGALFGFLNISIVAFAEQSDPAMTGVLLAAMSFGSLVSGLILGSVRRRWSLTNQVRFAVITLTLGLIPLAFISSAWVFAAVAFLAGLSISITMIGAFALVERMVPNIRITEGLAFLSSGLSLGMAGGAFLAGILIDAYGPSLTLGLSALCAAIGAVIFWSSSRRIARIEAEADALELADQPPARATSTAPELVLADAGHS